MTLSLHSASAPVFIEMLTALEKIIIKAAAHAAARKIDESVFLTGRLAPDMFTFTRQVQIGCDFTTRTMARLAGVEPPKMPDTETSFAELQKRIAAARDYVSTISATQLAGRDAAEITFPTGPDSTMTLSAADYLTGWALPNFYFHLTTAYAILRHNGVEIGKRDFLGRA